MSSGRVFASAILRKSSSSSEVHLLLRFSTMQGYFTVPVVRRTFAFFGGFSPGSFERICRIVSIMARIASGRVTGAGCLAIQPSRAASWEGCRRTCIGVPLPVGAGPRRFFDCIVCFAI